MQLPVNVFSELSGNAFDGGQLFNAGVRHPAQTTKTRQEFLATFGTDTLNLFQT
jgi:hypothetical protein